MQHNFDKQFHTNSKHNTIKDPFTHSTTEHA